MHNMFSLKVNCSKHAYFSVSLLLFVLNLYCKPIDLIIMLLLFMIQREEMESSDQDMESEKEEEEEDSEREMETRDGQQELRAQGSVDEVTPKLSKAQERELKRVRKTDFSWITGLIVSKP